MVNKLLKGCTVSQDFKQLQTKYDKGTLEVGDLTAPAKSRILGVMESNKEMMGYMRNLNDWLERDAKDRDAQIRSVMARLDSERHPTYARPPVPEAGKFVELSVRKLLMAKAQYSILRSDSPPLGKAEKLQGSLEDMERTWQATLTFRLVVGMHPGNGPNLDGRAVRKGREESTGRVRLCRSSRGEDCRILEVRPIKRLNTRLCGSG